MQSKTPAPGESGVSTRVAATGFSSPTTIAAIQGSTDTRLFIVEQAGTIRSVIPFESSQPEMFLDIRNKIQAGGEMGLLGLAFHPHYDQNGFVFINYTDKENNTVVSRYHIPEGSTAVDPDSEKIVFTVTQPYDNHNGGDLAFGSDGFLYVTLGDGGRAGDPDNRAQNKDSFFGKILRVNVDTNEPYTVPDSNPFVGQANAKSEIWAYGLRNPWRISFDSATGDLYIADVGQGNMEEIDFQPAHSKGGINYGWRCFEGTREYNNQGCEGADGYEVPIVEYDHSDGRCSVTGGYVYRGETYPALKGKYFYGDFCGGQIFSAKKEGSIWKQTLEAETQYSISAFGQATDGELYFADYKDGGIYRVEVE